MEKYLCIKNLLPGIVFFFIGAPSWAQSVHGFKLVEKPGQSQIDIVFNNKLLTSYVYLDSIKKPILFPVNSLDGITVTRGFPIHKVSGERTDHPHHTGIWLNYESVNGLDFWNNSNAIAPDRRHRYGTILHKSIVNKKAGKKQASITATASWVRPDQKVLLDEKSIYQFTVANNDFIIDRITTLTARDTAVLFKDVKDGMFAIRLARELEQPSKEKTNYLDDKGNITTVDPSSQGATGLYLSSNGMRGDSVWGTKGNWVMLTGMKENKPITIAMFDHPSNIGYPAYWHARGYGLFAVNPLGRKIFSNGTDELNFSLKPKEAVTFRYRVIIHSGPTGTPSEMNKWASDFSKIK